MTIALPVEFELSVDASDAQRAAHVPMRYPAASGAAKDSQADVGVAVRRGNPVEIELLCMHSADGAADALDRHFSDMQFTASERGQCGVKAFTAEYGRGAW